jgi:hypothetical protein
MHATQDNRCRAGGEMLGRQAGGSCTQPPSHPASQFNTCRSVWCTQAGSKRDDSARQADHAPSHPATHLKTCRSSW